MELKGRLKLIASKVPACEVLCDIGTDHAYIPIYLVGKGVCEKAVAADVKRGPILAAQENIRLYNMEERIQTRLGDGLKPINQGEADVIVLAGMGGMLITEILAAELEKAKAAMTLVLQPMNTIEVVRKWLYENGFDIYDEELISEGSKIYNVIATRWTGDLKKVEEIRYYIGDKLVEKNDPLLERHINKKLKQVEAVIEELTKTDHSDKEVLPRYENLKNGYMGILQKIHGNQEVL